MEKTTKVVRNYKDTVFRMLFQDKAHLLELYNAVNQTAYENPEELEIVTLENAVYLGMKNDVAFLIEFQYAASIPAICCAGIREVHRTEPALPEPENPYSGTAFLCVL